MVDFFRQAGDGRKTGIGRARRQEPCAALSKMKRREDGQRGFVLVVALVLVALMAGPAYFALAYGRTAVWQTERLRATALLRIEAGDALWAELLRLRAVSGTNTATDAASKINPAGFVTHTAIRKIEASALPAPLARYKPPVAGETAYLVRAESTADDRAISIESYVARGTGGVIRILAWLER